MYNFDYVRPSSIDDAVQARGGVFVAPRCRVYGLQ